MDRKVYIFSERFQMEKVVLRGNSMFLFLAGSVVLSFIFLQFFLDIRSLELKFVTFIEFYSVNNSLRGSFMFSLDNFIFIFLTFLKLGFFNFRFRLGFMGMDDYF